MPSRRKLTLFYVRPSSFCSCRNPLSAAICACSFLMSALQEHDTLSDPEIKKNCHEDIAVINSSLNFVNDFLRSMVDIHRANDHKIQIEMAPADLYHDVLEPVSAMLHTRLANYKGIVECPNNLVVLTDAVRLKVRCVPCTQ